ncbi:RNA 2',3'-cyclic phosphodiesterase [Amycolatopsis thermalba]|uniref:RNA 2',3'-cyclic phosphodiesterase n=1 Tax=Amycolatopsis thermalba TaxID=944492 RepID=A0ABY4NVF2_9PSEU|nr:MULTISPECIES: RNA 2',3'-cyclic phosphodiesterase [Amycolatopsis]UQS24050.1 RNA 2',3'-cyclic phosphodiesterase [Amycolatopsis thermalba]
MVLFSAVLPPADVVATLTAEIGGLPELDGVRWSSPDNWHVTLGFYGEEDPAERAGWLRPRLAGMPAPRIWLEGAGTFTRVLYLGVYGEGITELGLAAGAGDEGRPYLPHLTLARTRERVPPELARRLSGYRSRMWTAAEAVLMRSQRTAGGVRYAVVERFPLSQQAR